MSHAPERAEKNCLNCGTTVAGRYCQHCGQENIVPKESFGSLVIHFFYDITHFDGKFFETLKYLLFRPGFLSTEFNKGRRATYLNPIRMYVFTSALFFLVFFIIVKPEGAIKTNTNIPMTGKERLKLSKSLKKELSKEGVKDSSNLMLQISVLEDTTKPLTNGQFARIDSTGNTIQFTNTDYVYRKDYDSVQKSLPKSERDGFFKRTLIYRQISLNEKLRQDPDHFLDEFFVGLLHRLPYILFVSLPLFAMWLKLLYVRRKNFYYADHAIFTIHHYIFSFILLLFFFLIGTLRDVIGWKWIGDVALLMLWVWPVYLYIAMKKFYKQGWFKTLMKFLLLNLLGLITLLILFVLFFFFAIFNI